MRAADLPGGPDLLHEIREALKQATPGPWLWNNKADGDDEDDPKYADYRLMGGDSVIVDLQIDHHEKIWWQGVSDADAHLIAHAPEWLQALVSRCEQAEQRLLKYEPDGVELAPGREWFANECIRLRGERDRLREALGKIAGYKLVGTEMTLHHDFIGIARAALAPGAPQ